MKKIFSTLILIFLYPFKLFKKDKNYFLSGLIIGALFSLLVNIFTVQIQETIKKQRILEALENEIVSNRINATILMNQVAKMKRGIEKYTYFYTFQKYSRDLWEQSSDPLQYIAQLNPEVQIKIGSYYTYTIPQINDTQQRFNSVFDIDMKDCINISFGESLECNNKYYDIRNAEVIVTASLIEKESLKVLKVFHPTKDRLNSIWLKLLMGDESIRVLSGV